MPIDKALLKNVRAAEQGPRNFVFAPGKSENVLVLSKAKINKGEVDKAKQQSGGSLTLKGVCQENDEGVLVFRTTANPPSGLDLKIKRTIKESTGLNKPVQIVRVDPADLVEVDDSTPDAPELTGEPTDKESSTAAKATYESTLDRLPSLIDQLKQLAPRSKHANAAAGVIDGALQKAAAAAGQKDYAGAAKLLGDAEARGNAAIQYVAALAPVMPTYRQVGPIKNRKPALASTAQKIEDDMNDVFTLADAGNYTSATAKLGGMPNRIAWLLQSAGVKPVPARPGSPPGTGEGDGDGDTHGTSERDEFLAVAARVKPLVKQYTAEAPKDLPKGMLDPQWVADEFRLAVESGRTLEHAEGLKRLNDLEPKLKGALRVVEARKLAADEGSLAKGAAEALEKNFDFQVDTAVRALGVIEKHDPQLAAPLKQQLDDAIALRDSGRQGNDDDARESALGAVKELNADITAVLKDLREGVIADNSTYMDRKRYLERRKAARGMGAKPKQGGGEGEEPAPQTTAEWSNEINQAIQGGAVKIGRALKAGANGAVLELVSARGDVPPLVMKRPLNVTERAMKELEREHEAYQKVGDHPNIAKSLGVVEVGGVQGMVMEGIRGKDMSGLTEAMQAKLASGEVNQEQFWGTLQYTMAKTLEAIAFVNQKGFAHNDIKPDNVMLDADTGEVKLIDFGLVDALGKDQREETEAYSAPERAAQQRDIKSSTKADAFSAGASLFQAGQGKLFDFGLSGMADDATTSDAKKDYIQPGEGGFEKQVLSGLAGNAGAYRDLVNWLMNPDPAKRPTAEQALKHPFFRDRLFSDEQAQEVVKSVVGEKTSAAPGEAERAKAEDGFQYASADGEVGQGLAKVRRATNIRDLRTAEGVVDQNELITRSSALSSAVAQLNVYEQNLKEPLRLLVQLADAATDPAEVNRWTARRDTVERVMDEVRTLRDECQQFLAQFEKAMGVPGGAPGDKRDAKSLKQLVEQLRANQAIDPKDLNNRVKAIADQGAQLTLSVAQLSSGTLQRVVANVADLKATIQETRDRNREEAATLRTLLDALGRAKPLKKGTDARDTNWIAINSLLHALQGQAETLDGLEADADAAAARADAQSRQIAVDTQEALKVLHEARARQGVIQEKVQAQADALRDLAKAARDEGSVENRAALQKAQAEAQTVVAGLRSDAEAQVKRLDEQARKLNPLLGKLEPNPPQGGPDLWTPIVQALADIDEARTILLRFHKEGPTGHVSWAESARGDDQPEAVPGEAAYDSRLDEGKHTDQASHWNNVILKVLTKEAEKFIKNKGDGAVLLRYGEVKKFWGPIEALHRSKFPPKGDAPDDVAAFLKPAFKGMSNITSECQNMAWNLVKAEFDKFKAGQPTAMFISATDIDYATPDEHWEGQIMPALSAVVNGLLGKSEYKDATIKGKFAEATRVLDDFFQPLRDEHLTIFDPQKHGSHQKASKMAPEMLQLFARAKAQVEGDLKAVIATKADGVAFAYAPLGV